MSLYSFFKLSVHNPILQFLVLIVVLVLVIFMTKKLTKLYVVKNAIEPHRRKLILNMSYVLYHIIALFIALPIFGLQIKDVVVFGTSVLAVVGVGFFAQWSILSNLTASVILFFYHPMRIGDTIKIIDKEYEGLTGKIKNITGFYVTLYIAEGNRNISVPNNVILFKGIEIVKSSNS